MVRNLTAGQELKERQVRSLNREDPLEEEMENHSNILDGIIPWTEEPGGLQSIGSQELDATKRLSTLALIQTHFSSTFLLKYQEFGFYKISDVLWHKENLVSVYLFLNILTMFVLKA